MKLFFCSSITALLVGLCGCCSSAPDSDKERFERIAQSLEPGGSSYVISSNYRAESAWKQIIRETERYIWDSAMPDQQKRNAQCLVSRFELLARLLGIHEIKGWGLSSKELSGGQGIFKNKARLLLPPSPKGVLWNLFSPVNTDLSRYFNNLPSDTFAAGALNMTPEGLEQLFNTDKELSDNIRQICQLFFQMSPQDVLKNISGVWRFTIVCDEDNNLDNFHGFHGALTIPDKQGKLFSALVSKMKFMSAVQVDQQKKIIKFPVIQGYAVTPVIRGSNETVTIYTSSAAIDRTTALSSFPQFGPFPAACQKQFPSEGVAAFYVRNDVTDVASKNLDTVTVRPAWAVIKRMKDGFLSTDLSPCDLNEHIARTAMIFPVQFLFEIVSAPQAPSGRKTTKVPSAPKRPVKLQTVLPKQKQNSCLQGISRAGEALLAAVKKNKKWPVPGIAGLRQLIDMQQIDRRLLSCPLIKYKDSSSHSLSYANCHYLYFGQPGKSSPNTPLLVELPFLHKEYIAVFYANGKVEKIHLTGRRNARRAISYLHTLHSYEEEEFMRLMQLAGEFDKILER